jgi:hypothetical protein
VIAWLNDLGNDWGRWRRHMPSGWPHRSLAGTIAEEGSVGAAIKAHMQIIPIRDSTRADVLEFNNAWRLANPETKTMLFVHHYLRGDVSAKARALDMSRATFYRRVDAAHVQIWSDMIGDESGVSKVRLEMAACV